jgi:hypothetical protein
MTSKKFIKIFPYHVYQLPKKGVQNFNFTNSCFNWGPPVANFLTLSNWGSGQFAQCASENLMVIFAGGPHACPPPPPLRNTQTTSSLYTTEWERTICRHSSLSKHYIQHENIFWYMILTCFLSRALWIDLYISMADHEFKFFDIYN